MNNKKESTTLGNIALAFFLIQTVAIGILPTVLGWNSLAVCSWGSMSYGMYALVRPGRIIYRMKPKVPAGSFSEFCVKDLIRVWALFCVALGAMGLSIHRAAGAVGADHESTSNSTNGPIIRLLTKLQLQANAIFLVVGLVSMAWDWYIIS